MSIKNMIVGVMCTMIISCNPKKNEEIKSISIDPFEAKEVKLSSFVDSISYIKLETSEDCILGTCLVIKIKTKYIYIWDVDQESVLVFDKSGHHAATLDKVGKGPGEFTWISWFFVDEEETYIDILDDGINKLITYKNLTFEHISSVDVPELTFDHAIKANNHYYFSTNSNNNFVNDKKTNADIIVMDENNNLSTLFDKNIVTKEGNVNLHFSIYNNTLVKDDNNSLYCSVPFDNNFYKITKDKVSPVINIDYQGHGIDNNIGKTSTHSQSDYLLTESFINKACFPALILNDDDVFSFNYMFRTKTTDPKYSKLNSYLELKKKGVTIHTNKIINDLTDFPKEVSIGNGFTKGDYLFDYDPKIDNYLIDVICLPIELEDNPIDSISNFKSVGNVSLLDNPILVLMRLKE